MSKELEALERLYCEGNLEQHKKDYEFLKNALQRLESIDNANHSEAIECLEKLGTHRIEYREGFELGFTKTMPFKSTMEYKIIKQALLKAQEQEKFFDDKLVFKNGCIMSGFDYKGKQIVTMPLEKYDEFMKQEKAQEPKQYLKWEDLEFDDKEQRMDVSLNGHPHLLCYYRTLFGSLCMIDNTGITIREDNKYFFNDLHLERVE